MAFVERYASHSPTCIPTAVRVNKRPKTGQQASFMRQGITLLNYNPRRQKNRTNATNTLLSLKHFSRLPMRHRYTCLSGLCYNASSSTRYYRHLSVNSTTKCVEGHKSADVQHSPWQLSQKHVVLPVYCKHIQDHKQNYIHYRFEKAENQLFYDRFVSSLFWDVIRRSLVVTDVSASLSVPSSRVRE